MIYHGYGRTTGDMDVWLKPDNQNRDKLIPVLENFGILPEDVDHIKTIDFAQVLAFIWMSHHAELTFSPK